MKELRVIIAGSREFNDFRKLTDKCDDILNEITKTHDDIQNIRIISGAARGADQLGEQYAKNAGHQLSIFHADWDGIGKSAGYVRNGEMAKFAVEDDNYGVLIALWNGTSRGTKHMIDLATRMGLEVYIVQF